MLHHIILLMVDQGMTLMIVRIKCKVTLLNFLSTNRATV